MNGNGYISLFNASGNSGYTSLFTMSLKGETAGSVAANKGSSSGGYGGETAGSIADSSGSCFGYGTPSSGGGSSSGGSFSSVA